jgi:photosystem II stability/assembly factor-like uncharacterized protein
MKVYAATSDRGIFASADGGATWTASSSGIQSTRVQALAVAGSPPVLYAGLGSATEYPLVRSADGGATWVPSGSGIGTSYLDTIVVDKKTPTTLYAGISDSTFFYKTTDGGDHWSSMNLGTTPASIIWTIAVDPTNSSNVYAATNNGVYISSDGGSTWSSSPGGFPGVVYSLVIDPNTPSTLYGGALGIVLQSIDSGAHWKPALSVNSFAFRSLAIDPSNSSVYAGGYYAVYKSTDGNTWKLANGGVWAPSVNALTIDPNNASIVFMGVEAAPDVFVTKLDPTGTLVYSTYLGGAADDGAAAIALDAAGNAYVAGYTCSADFPLVSDLFLTKSVGCDDGFATQLDPSGFVGYSTLLSQSFSADVFGIAVDAAGNAYVTGWTGSTTLPVVGGLQQTYRGAGDAFVMKVKP